MINSEHEKKYVPNVTQKIVDLFLTHRSVLKEYLRKHDEKELAKDDLKPTTNPFMEKSAVSQSGAGDGYPRGADLNQPSGQNGNVRGQQILVMLLRLRQCCSHLSLMKDVSIQKIVVEHLAVSQT